MNENVNRVRNLRRNDALFPERAVEDGFQLCQARFGAIRQMQSYYGSSPAAKRFEVTGRPLELQLPEYPRLATRIVPGVRQLCARGEEKARN